MHFPKFVKLREVHQLQTKQAVRLYLLICGLDDQDAADWEKDTKSNLLRSDPIQVMTKGTQGRTSHGAGGGEGEGGGGGGAGGGPGEG